MEAARRLRPTLSLQEVEVSHGRRAARAVADVW
jgi:hypothetical protein